MKIDNINDEQINKAIEMRESGKKDTEVFKMFPGIKDELYEVFEIIDMLRQNGKKVKAPENLLRKVLINVPRQTRTESILKQNNIPSVPHSGIVTSNSYKGRPFSETLSLILNSMNKKTALSIGIIILLFVFAVGTFFLLPKKQTKNFTNQNIAIENEIDNEKAAFEKDSADLDELANDNSANEIASGLSGIESEIESSMVIPATEFELFEKELAYEIENLSGDLEGTSGIESDTSLNTISLDLGGV